MDRLISLLPAMRVERAACVQVDATAPWGLYFTAHHHAKFGVVLHGRCWIAAEGIAGPVALAAGDWYLLPRGDAFSLRDCLDTPLQPFGDIAQATTGQALRLGGGGELTTIMGGQFLFKDRPPLLHLLPPLVHFKANASELQRLRAVLLLLAEETTASSIGSPLVVDRLTDIFFVQTLRAYVRAFSRHETNWLNAVNDPQIITALDAIHDRPDRPWTVESLAARAGMSRSAFAYHFKRLIGDTPVGYLSRLRIDKACRLLCESSLTIGQIAAAVGYDSEASFNKAFKKRLGLPPGRYRRRREQRCP